ncbi:hypothetical protein EJ08DRAFT_686079 [Tothia fuscella]|uniref:Uncharacterized protein n=1 Tax=Tothia fuscella TaxID=1048955 RepID=A0A9P4NYH2_9PEZI|nr:hypothetical protein EJ08DRAFT_686079 [Tothia fuscella]
MAYNFPLEKLRFLQLDEWEENNSYDKEEPTCLYSFIKWTVFLNNKKILKNTKQVQVAQNRHIRCEDTTIVTSVNHRSEPDLVIEKQIIEWGEHFRSGKRLRISISFNYVDSQLPASTTKGGFKRGLSATQRMQSIRQDFYTLMRCPRPLYDLGPHCCIEPVGKKYYKLRTHHLRSLIEHVEAGEPLRNHDDVPDNIRAQLVVDEQQRLGRRPNAMTTAPSPFPPINITNVLPSSHTPSSLQQLNIIDKDQKKGYQEACRIILGDGLDLEQVSKGHKVDLLIRKGIKRGVAWRYINDIPAWAKRQKQSHNAELD